MRSHWLLVLLFTAASLAAQGDETLSEQEQLRYQLVVAQSQIADLQAKLGACQVELAPLRTKVSTDYVKAQLAQLKEDIEAQHPGHVFDVEKGMLTPKPEKR